MRSTGGGRGARGGARAFATRSIIVVVVKRRYRSTDAAHALAVSPPSAQGMMLPVMSGITLRTERTMNASRIALTAVLVAAVCLVPVAFAAPAATTAATRPSVDFGDASSSTLTSKAWAALDAKRYD